MLITVKTPPDLRIVQLSFCYNPAYGVKNVPKAPNPCRFDSPATTSERSDTQHDSSWLVSRQSAGNLRLRSCSGNGVWSIPPRARNEPALLATRGHDPSHLGIGQRGLDVL